MVVESDMKLESLMAIIKEFERRNIRYLIAGGWL